jgi:hypothetical protein
LYVLVIAGLFAVMPLDRVLWLTPEKLVMGMNKELPDDCFKKKC